MTVTLARYSWPFVGRVDERALFRRSVADPRCLGYFVVGAPGVGKTRLADECLATAQESGLPVARVAAGRMAGSIPLGALIHLMPGSSRPAVRARQGEALLPEAVELFERARAAVRQRAGGRRLVLLVDDIDLLDPVSARLVEQLTAAGEVFLVGTYSDTAPTPDPAGALWREGRANRIDLGDLDRTEVTALLERALDGPVSAAAAAALWTSSRGNPLLLRELVHGCTEEGTLVRADGVWQLTSRPTTPVRVRGVIATRIAGLDGGAHAALEFLAVCEPVDLAGFGDQVGMPMVELLETEGLITVTADGDRHAVSLSHPLYRQAFLDFVPRSRVERILRAQIDKLAAAPCRRPADPLRIANWQLEIDGTADPELLLRGAQLSHAAADFAVVERLARATLAADCTPEAGALAAALLGEALAQSGRIDEADGVFAEAMEYAPADESLRRLAILRAAHLCWGVVAPDRAIATIDQARSVLDDTHLNELSAVRALVFARSDRAREAGSLLDAMPPPGPGGVSMIEGVARATAFAALGRTDAAIAAAAGLRYPYPARGVPRLHPAFLDHAAATAAHEAGRLREAIALAERGLRAAVEDEVITAQAVLTCLMGRCQLTRGRPRTAARWFREAVAISRRHGCHEELVLALAGLAVADAQSRDVDGGDALAADASEPTGTAVTQGLVPQAEAWALVSKGHLDSARQRLSAAADAMIESGQLSLAAALLHDIARLGDAKRALPRLLALRERTDSPMIAARARYAEGVAHRDAKVLAGAAAAFAEMGADLFEAEATAEQRPTDPRHRAAIATRIGELRVRCEGARTPPLAGAGQPSPLSGREREICLLAAGGLSSIDIAERLVVSVRTVNNHLQNAYRKLGVTSRRELMQALDQPAR
ncbi:helix-turn-helix transcriptional regulator [Pseudonocardia sp. GCM10023141]|uniref:helix-turn-helix transcriptional regulator n=1 Tax=Pseudonocardia sp. GCM10023141 TaxID=3252653 RepID=UPI0036193F30